MIPLFPMLVLELQSHCNRDCSFCARSYDRSGARKDAGGLSVRKAMPTDHAVRLISEAHALGFKGPTTFYLYSEPFLDPRLVTIASKARSLGMYPFVNTNGDVLRKDASLRREAARVFGHVEIGLYDAKTPQEVTAQMAWWRSNMGGNLVFNSLNQKSALPGNGLTQATYPQATCLRPAEKCIVMYDGRAAVCCYDMRSQWDIPNAFRSSLKEVWWNTNRQICIEALRSPGGRNQFPLCRGCCMPATGSPPPAGWTTT